MSSPDVRARDAVAGRPSTSLTILAIVAAGAVAGAFVAVPLMAAIKIFADHIDRDSRLAAVLDE